MDPASRRYRTDGLTPLLFLATANSVAILLFLAPVPAGDGRRPQLAAIFFTLLVASVLALGLWGRRSSLARFRLVARRGAVVDVTMLGLAFLAVGGLLVGLLRGNEPELALGDSGKLALTVVIYTVARNTLSTREQLWKMTLVFAVLLSLQQLRDAYATGSLFLVQGGVTRLASLLWCQNLAAFIALFLFAVKARGARLFGLMLALLVVAGTGGASGYRTYLVLVAMVVVAPLLLHFRRSWAGYLRLAGACGLALAGIVVTLLALGRNPSILFKPVTLSVGRVEATVGAEGADVSSGQRVAEIKAILGELREDGPALLAGKGAGATFELPVTASLTALDRHAKDSYRAHHIHNSLASFLFRYGILGFAAFAILTAWALVASFGQLVAEREPVLWWAPLVTISYLLASQFFLFIPGDLVFSAALAMVAAAPGLRQRRREKPVRRAA